ncbi:MAG TPA: hypothetical protein VLZ74_07045 [Methylocella sp.]|nr:hypothetical protein [Methylocella sp.]
MTEPTKVTPVEPAKEGSGGQKPGSGAAESPLVTVTVRLPARRSMPPQGTPISESAKCADAGQEATSYNRRRPASLYIIYDASYLFHGGDIFYQFVLHARPITNVVSKETISEIRRKYSEGCRDIAGVARGTVLKLLQAQSREGAYAQYIEPQLSDIVEPEVPSEPLGADSRTDRLLIAYGRYLLANGHATTVAIATRDGGIALSLHRLRTHEGLQLYHLYDEHSPAEIAAVRKSLQPHWP